jgi:anti-sigma regulatory factor (Ser/Thr protein kinase)
VTEPNFARELPRTSQCARLAREFLQDSVPHSAALDSLELIASELVTNAFKHGVGDMYISLATATGSDLRLQVNSDFDASAGQPNLDAVTAVDPLNETGRGLHIVNALSSAWGWEVLGSTLFVWAEIAG